MAAPHIMSDLDEAKRALRARALALRAGCDPAASGAALTEHVLAAACAPPAGAVVSGFWPIGEEIDIRPLLHRLHARGHTVALPVTPKRGNPLSFRTWQPGDVLQPERFGTFRPVGQDVVPDFLLVPLLAFDRRGYRVGYGGGFYDRTLAALPHAFALGVAYAAQQVDAVPTGPHDKRLNAVATEDGVIFCKDA
ncbi:MAG TPA: 5-formyltetrahydrofolate cyclo-ligase [Acetobacteraceae bacterium]|nr:5-formyltetrahydrofolate cyclo-ligase [Acetobacteraceae bacterium]